jgi:BirA family biotin operon repressor/biotin-[acetyl-CoA-carboxylase] ligase
MLLESTQYAGEKTAQGFVIVGIGVNVNQQDFPPDLAARSTSLMLQIGQRVCCDEFVDGLMTHFARHYLSVYEDDGSVLRAAFVERMTELGESITLYFHGGRPPVVGRMAGLSSDGGLELELKDGRQLTFHAGEVTSDAGWNTDRTS